MLPNPMKPYRVVVDTSTKGRGIGAILLQQAEWSALPSDLRESLQKKLKEEPWLPVAYWSRLLTAAERARGITAAEALGFVESIKHWTMYLQNGHEFTVVVDHQAITFLLTAPLSTGNRQIIRLILELQNHRFNLVYKKGAHHIDADAVSRLFRFGDREILDQMSIQSNTTPVTDDDVQLARQQRDLLTKYGTQPRSVQLCAPSQPTLILSTHPTITSPSMSPSPLHPSPDP